MAATEQYTPRTGDNYTGPLISFVTCNRCHIRITEKWNLSFSQTGPDLPASHSAQTTLKLHDPMKESNFFKEKHLCRFDLTYQTQILVHLLVICCYQRQCITKCSHSALSWSNFLNTVVPLQQCALSGKQHVIFTQCKSPAHLAYYLHFFTNSVDISFQCTTNNNNNNNNIVFTINSRSIIIVIHCLCWLSYHILVAFLHWFSGYLYSMHYR